MKQLNLDDWVTMQRRRKWGWAHKLATTTHDAWTTIASHWGPTLDTQLRARRRPGHPKTRWTDDSNDHLQHVSVHADKNVTLRHTSDHDNNNDDGDADTGGDTNIGAKMKVDNKLHQNYEVPREQLATDKQLWSDMESGYVTRKLP